MGCLRKETCRAASPGFKLGPSYLGNRRMWWGGRPIVILAVFVCIRGGEHVGV